MSLQQSPAQFYECICKTGYFRCVDNYDWESHQNTTIDAQRVRRYRERYYWKHVHDLQYI